jgi:hypothetical protein
MIKEIIQRKRRKSLNTRTGSELVSKGIIPINNVCLCQSIKQLYNDLVHHPEDQHILSEREAFVAGRLQVDVKPDQLAFKMEGRFVFLTDRGSGILTHIECFIE